MEILSNLEVIMNQYTQGKTFQINEYQIYIDML